MKIKLYSRYKDSGISWIGEIPEDWSINKIKRTTYVKGRIGWQGLTSEEYQDEGAYLVTGTDFEKGKINWSSCHHISWDRYKEDPYIHLKENDLLITKDGTIGKVALVKNLLGKATLNSGVFVIRPLEKYITQYMYWVLNSLVFERFFDYFKKGATISHLYQEMFEEFVFPIPSIDEQTKISKFLASKTENLFSLIDRNIRLIELFEEKRESLINRCVSRGLNLKVSMKSSKTEWIPKVPENWEVQRIKFVAEKVITGRTPDSENSSYYTEGEINWFCPGDLGNKFTLVESERKITKKAIREKQAVLCKTKTVLLVGIGATIGKVGIILDRGTSNQQINAITFDEDKIEPQFGLFFLSAYREQIIKFSNASTIGIFNQTQTKNFQIIVPPKNDQTEIVKFIIKQTSKIDSAITRIQKRIDLLEEYKTSLINRVITGKIDVRE